MREGKRERKNTEHLLCSLVMVTELKNSVFRIHVSIKGCVTSLVLKCFCSPPSAQLLPSSFSHKDILYNRGISFSWDLSSIGLLYFI